MTTSFEALAKSEAPGLLNYFARRVEPSDAADLLADVLLVAWRRRAAVPPGEIAARMWLYGVARKTLANHRRSRIRYDALAMRLRAELIVQPAGPDSDQDRGLALDLLELVNPIDREILMLVYWDGFSLTEVAQLLHRNASSVRARHARALAKLRSVIAPDHAILTAGIGTEKAPHSWREEYGAFRTPPGT